MAALSVMNMSVYFASECPVGCGELTFVQSKSDGNVFCYCTGCGIGFNHPRDIKVDSKLDISNTLKSLAPDGIVLPTKDAIEKSGLGQWITDTADEKEWYSEQEINNDLHT